jgi:hypothetical protein
VETFDEIWSSDPVSVPVMMEQEKEGAITTYDPGRAYMSHEDLEASA